MSKLLTVLARRRVRFLIATLVSVIFQGSVLMLPAVGGWPILSTVIIAVPCLIVLLPTSAAGAKFARHSFHRDNVLGTSLDLYVATTTADVAKRCEEAVFAEVTRLARILDTRNPDSEISRLNRDARVPSGEVREVLDLCDKWRSRSGGAFDHRVGEFVRLWREAGEQNALPDAVKIRERLNGREDAQQTLDLDAIGKAYILDRAARAAQAMTGVNGLLLNVGGDIVALGDCDGREGTGWLAGVTDPSRPEDNAPRMTQLRLRDQAVATSAAYERPIFIKGTAYSNIVDPRTGWPAKGVTSATVVAPDATTANALATALNVLSPEEGLRLVSQTPGAECLLVAANGTRYRSSLLIEKPVVAASKNWPDGQEVTVAVTLTRQTTGRWIHRPYVAVWIEDAEGKAVRTLAVWGPNQKYLKHLSDWWRLNRKNDALIESVTKATRAPGKYRLVWDGTDDKGNTVSAGMYSVHIEVHREHGKHVRQTGKILCGEQKVSVTLDATAETGEAELKCD